MTPRLERLVILGGGTAGWLAAAMLARFVPRTTQITLVDSAEIGSIGVGEATIPQIRLLTAGLGLDESKLLAAVDGTFKLGIEFIDWWRPDTRYMHAFGGVGSGHGVVPFHHLWLRGQALGIAEPLGRYAPTEVAARQNKFGHSSDLAYAYHFDAGLLAVELRALAEAAGVRRVEGFVEDVERGGREEGICALQCRDGSRIEGDFFIDCSGFRSLLLGKALGVAFESSSHLLPCNRAVAGPAGATADMPPYTQAFAHRAGWRWRIPLQSRTGNGIVFSSRHLSDDEAAGMLAQATGGKAASEPRLLAFEPGRRARVWDRNVLAVGLASGFLEPLESTSIHLVQSAMGRFLEFFPSAEPEPFARETYNQQTRDEFDSIRDFLVLHYLTSERDEPFWREARSEISLPRLDERLEEFRLTGRIRHRADELFTPLAWLQVMNGQGVHGTSWSPLADEMTAEELRDHLAAVSQAAAQRSRGLANHAEFIARYCAARRS